MAHYERHHQPRPYFDGSQYSKWKFKMETYMDCYNVDVWESVINGWKHPTEIIGDEERRIPRDRWTEAHKRSNGKNKLAMYILLSCLSDEEVGRVQHCTTAQAMWKTLENYHEGTQEVKSRKIQMYVTEYETFKMKPNESITDMTNRLLVIINNMKKLGKTYELVDVNNKILRTLPMDKYGARVVSIKKANEDLGLISTDVLIGKLFTHEIALIKQEQEKVSSKKKKKALALKAKAISKSDFSSDDEDEGEQSDEEMAYLARRLKRIIEVKKKKGNKNFKRASNKINSSKDRKEDITCYECGKQGHIKPECPKLLKKKNKEKFKKKKAYKATWDDSSSSPTDESDKREQTNHSLMAKLEESNEE